ncbi:MAG: DnaJ domain-containing protein [Nitrospirae bacterium]|nr:DnaJ domain-containing protein [Nitrospirota bacterium]
MSGLILAINRISYKIPSLFRIKERFLFNPDVSFKVDAVINSLKICLTGIVFAAIFQRLPLIEFIGFVVTLFIFIYLWMILRGEKFFGSTDMEKIKSERIKIRRLHKQAELDRERANAELKMVEEMRQTYENKYKNELENIKIEYLKLDQLRTQTEMELQKVKKERDIALERERYNKNTVDTKEYIKLQTENYRLQNLLIEVQQELQKTDDELKYLKEQKTVDIFAKEAAKIQNEYLKVEQMKIQAQDELAKANAERKRAMELFKKAEEELSKTNLTIGLNEHHSHNPYEILGVHPSDSMETIREIYKKLICIYHPDKHGSLNLLSKKQKNDFMAKINASYDLVTKQQKIRCN